MKILHVVGGRPNFMKMAPVYNALKKYKVRQMVVHTGQHYSHNMSSLFFEQLNIQAPEVNLGVGSNSHAAQVAEIMKKFEKVLRKEKPDIVLVYGDMNSTMAAALVCVQLWIPVSHVEAGLRSRDWQMPEEINRIVTDSVSSLHFTPSTDADANLLKEGVEKKKIHFVGNVMIDTLVALFKVIKQRPSTHVSFKTFGVVTLHRPSNVDDAKNFSVIIKNLNSIAQRIPLVFPVHPRTRKILKRIKSLSVHKNLLLIDPLGYIDFLALVSRSALVITDSGGIQEETTYLKIPCFTMRKNTERPITEKVGSNTVVGNNFKLLNKKINEVLSGTYKKGTIPHKWDGRAAKRIAKVLMRK